MALSHPITNAARRILTSTADALPLAPTALLVAFACSSSAAAQTLSWVHVLGAPQSEDTAWSGCPDGAGGIFVGGNTGGILASGGTFAGFSDAFIARIDPSGNQLWVTQFGGEFHDGARCLTPDGTGGVFVGGHTDNDLFGPSAGLSDVFVARLDSAGNQVWANQMGDTGYDYCTAIAADGAGGFFVCGHTDGSLGGQGSGDDGWLARYDAQGQQLWIRQVGGGGNDYAQGLAVDDQGGVYVTGYSNGTFAGPNAGFWDAWLARYDSLGNRVWVQQFGTDEHDFGDSVTPDGNGGVYVGGHTNTGTSDLSHDTWCRRIDAGGNESWLRQFDGSMGNDRTHVVFTDGTGGPSIAVNTWDGQNFGVRIVRYDALGNERWIKNVATQGLLTTRVAFADAAGSIYVAGMQYTTANWRDVWIGRFDNTFVSSSYCAPATNSTGQPAEIHAAGANEVAANNLTLSARQLPQSSFGFFIGSRTTGLATPPGNQGFLCLGGAIGRFVGPGQIMNSGDTGSFALTVDVTVMPQPTGSVAVAPGETWHFQAWYRDANPGATSNFTNGVRLTFN